MEASSAGGSEKGTSVGVPMRRKSRKKSVDRRASKGRKIKYVTHPKMQNFMFPRVSVAEVSSKRGLLMAFLISFFLRCRHDTTVSKSLHSGYFRTRSLQRRPVWIFVGGFVWNRATPEMRFLSSYVYLWCFLRSKRTGWERVPWSIFYYVNLGYKS